MQTLYEPDGMMLRTCRRVMMSDAATVDQPSGGARGCRGGASEGPARAGAAVSSSDAVPTSTISAGKFTASAGATKSTTSVRTDTAWKSRGCA